MIGTEAKMIVTCPACGRNAAVQEDAREVLCSCGRTFDPATRPTVADAFLGRDVCGYRIEEVIGSGGMGTVYKATQTNLGRPVALKVLPTNVADDPHFRDRFHREAEVLASLSHPHIVQVFDRGEHEGRWFIVMEYVDGTSLRQLMRRGPVPPKEACRIVTSLLGALDYAHKKGVVHRDIKPENVLVSEEGVVKVADFGLSRVTGGDDLETRLTRTHMMLGTYEYMAPEQREASQEADWRADLYATAVVLYEMLTGELPIGRFRLPSERVPGLDRRLDAVVERGLAKDPDDRYERASAMGAALESLLSTPDAPVDLQAIRGAAASLAERVRATFRRAADVPRAPTAFDLKHDLLLTVLAVGGILLVVTGFVLLVDGADFELGLLDIDGDVAGIVVMVFGGLLWNAAERARKFYPGARRFLLALTAMAAPTLVALPVTVWTWALFLHPRMRTYLDARFRGRDSAEAAAIAQNLPFPARERAEVGRRRARATRSNKRAAVVAGAFALAAWIVCLIAADDFGWRFKDEVAFFFTLAIALHAVQGFFFALMWHVGSGSWLRLNAWVWMLMSPFFPRQARTARMLCRDERDRQYEV